MKNFLFILIAVFFIFVLDDSFAQSSEEFKDSKNQYVPPASQNEQEKPYASPTSSGETKPPYILPEESKIPISVNEQIQESESVEESVVDASTQTEKVVAGEKSSKGGGCLIATATYGSEMAVEVQQLRELRDNQLLQTESGTAFISTFNDIYYSFSPTIADYERENPLFKEAVKLAITPMISTLSLMENAESESDVLSIGLSVIALNLGMYLGVPAIVVIGIRRII